MDSLSPTTACPGPDEGDAEVVGKILDRPVKYSLTDRQLIPASAPFDLPA
jgi:hypothetical protein